ncbi:MAG TPA: aminotransferase class III-fold pyridoxal phosphate-dependent enzyme, partial [Phycisphaerae bacterium]
MSNQEFITRHQSSMVLNYGKLPAVLVRGEGSRLWDADGKEFIDLFAGFGGTILGQAHPALVDAVSKQARALWAVGNQFHTEPQIRLAESLKRLAFDGRAFFCHSGAEANEAAIKLARISAGMNGGKEGRYKIISMQRGFHGRTLGALSATPTLDYQKGFFPLVPGFSAVPFDDLAALEAAIDPDTCAIITEPLQGEGGIYVPSENFLRGVRDICNKHKLSMIVDEVWTGCARTGKPFAHQYGGITPDMMTLGKALGGGLPTGCMFTTPERAAFLKPGTHGCTL